MDIIEKIKRDLSSADANIRRKAINRVSYKSGSAIVLKISDEGIIPILAKALSDSDREVQRAAARALRPWVQSQPDLIENLLPVYASPYFDGTYTHIGLYDIQQKRIWIPRFQAKRGHASLLSDGNTDRYFKFDFYRPNQIPKRFVEKAGNSRSAHLVFHLILDWSYSRQCLIPYFDERSLNRNRCEQEKFASSVIGFYKRCNLPYYINVHYLLMKTGESNIYEYNVKKIVAGHLT